MAHPGAMSGVHSTAGKQYGRREPRSRDWRQVVAEYEQEFPTTFPLLGDTYVQRVEAVLIDAGWPDPAIDQALKEIAN